jgi:hypothetical protein
MPDVAGGPLAFLPLRGAGHAELEMRAEIQGQNTRGPILPISGEDDQSVALRVEWPIPSSRA